MARQRKITFELDAENQKLKQKLDEVNQRLDNTKRKSGGLGATFKKVFGVLGLTGLITSAVLAFKELFGVMVDFDEGMRNVNSILGLSEKQFEAFSEEVLGVQKELGISSKELTDALYQTVSAGVEAGDAIAFLRDAGKIGIAGVATTTEAVDILTTTLNAFHLEASESSRVSDILFQTIKLGKTNLSELAASMAQVAPIAAANKVDFEEVSAAIATLTKQGVPTTQAVTQIRSSIISLNKTLGDGWAETMSYQEAVAEVAKQAGGSNNKLKEMLGRIEAVNAVLGLTGANATTAAEDLEKMQGALGASATAFEEQSKAISRRWKVFTAGFIADVTSVTDNLLDWLLPLEKSNTQVQKTILQTQKLTGEFTRLTSTYRLLRGQTELTAGETELYKGTIEDLNLLYPNYLKNINLEKDSLEKVETALDDAGLALDRYVQKQIQAAVLQERKDEIAALGASLIELEVARIETQVQLREAARRDDKFANLNYYQDQEHALLDFFKGQEIHIKEQQEKVRAQLKITQEVLKSAFADVVDPKKAKTTVVVDVELKGNQGDLLKEYIKLEKDYKETVIKNAEDVLKIYADKAKKQNRFDEEQIEFVKELAERDLEDAIAVANAKLEHWTGSEEKKRELLKETSALEGELDELRKQEAQELKSTIEDILGSATQDFDEFASNLEKRLVKLLTSQIFQIFINLFAGFFSGSGTASILEGTLFEKLGNIGGNALGVENFSGGLTKVHQGEALVNLPKGTNVHTKAETEKMFSTGRVEALLQELINETRVLQNPEPVIKADMVYKMYKRESDKRLI